MLMAFAAAVLGGGLTGLLIGFLKAKFNANEFLVSMMSTYVIQYLLQYLLVRYFRSQKRIFKNPVLGRFRVGLPKIIPGTSVSLGIVIAVLAAVFIWFVLYRTSLGYRIRVTGLNQDAAAMSGIKPGRMVYDSVFLSAAPLQALPVLQRSTVCSICFLLVLNQILVLMVLVLRSWQPPIPLAVFLQRYYSGTLQVGGTALGHSTDAPASVIDVMLGFVMLFVLMSFFVRRKLEIRKMKQQKIQKEGE